MKTKTTKKSTAKKASTKGKKSPTKSARPWHAVKEPTRSKKK